VEIVLYHDDSINLLGLWATTTDVVITDKSIQVGGAREGQSFVLKV
jgi:hypothetical protein